MCSGTRAREGVGCRFVLAGCSIKGRPCRGTPIPQLFTFTLLHYNIPLQSSQYTQHTALVPFSPALSSTIPSPLQQAG